MKTLRNKKFIDIFAGIGGFRIALEEHGAKCVFSSEIDKYAQQTYSENFSDEGLYGNIKKIKAKDIPDHNVLCAGFPCQPFSISGRQTGFEHAKGTLFFDIIRIANEKKPEVLFLENVSNLRSHKDKTTINEMENLLDQIGYHVNIEIINASKFGVPQTRKRVYFVCFRKDLDIQEFYFPKPTNDNIYLEDIIINTKENNEKYRIESDEIYLRDIVETNIKNKLGSIRIGKIGNGGQGNRIYSPKGHAITLTAHGGGKGAKTGAYLINGIVRKLSPRECARVQTFPDTFKIPVSDSQAWKQFGNSVSINVLKLILEKIEKSLQGAQKKRESQLDFFDDCAS